MHQAAPNRTTITVTSLIWLIRYDPTDQIKTIWHTVVIIQQITIETKAAISFRWVFRGLILETSRRAITSRMWNIRSDLYWELPGAKRTSARLVSRAQNSQVLCQTVLQITVLYLLKTRILSKIKLSLLRSNQPRNPLNQIQSRIITIRREWEIWVKLGTIGTQLATIMAPMTLWVDSSL